MNMKLLRLQIQNFKGIVNATLDNLGRTSIFVGRNGSGKSTVLGVLTKAMYGQSSLIFPKGWAPANEASPSELQFDFEFDVSASQEVLHLMAAIGNQAPDSLANTIGWQTTPHVRFRFEAESFDTLEQLDLQFTTVSILEGDREFLLLYVPSGALLLNDRFPYESTRRIAEAEMAEGKNEDTTQNDIDRAVETTKGFVDWLWRKFVSYHKAIRHLEAFRVVESTAHNVKQEDRLSPDARNLAGRLLSLPLREKRKVLEHFANLFPDHAGIDSQRIGDEEVWGHIRHNFEQFVRLAESGTGLSQALAILCLVFGESEAPLLCIEEPESNLHAGALRSLMKVCEDNLGSRMLFIATHSPSVISAFTSSTLFRCRYKGGACSIQPVAKGEEYSLVTELGHRPSEQGFYDCILWVEGPTDEPVFRHWIDMCRELKDIDIGIRPLGGDNIINPSYDVSTLKAVHPVSVCIVDSEMHLPEKKRLREKFKKHCEAVSMPCFLTKLPCTENYFPQHAIKNAVGTSLNLPKKIKNNVPLAGQIPNYKKKTWNRRIARKMKWVDIERTDLASGVFAELIKIAKSISA